MIAVDTNILVYAHRQDSPWHGKAAQCVKLLAEGLGSWAIAWPCVHEFISIATHPKIYARPSTLQETLEQVEAWMESPALHVLAESADYWVELRQLALRSQVRGPQIHDTRIAALCLQHGVAELWTADRDFSRYPAVKATNPLVR